MKGKRMLAIAMIAGMLALAGDWAISQDKYSLKVPNGLAFAEFKGYEGWQVIAISHSGNVMAATLGNPAMIKAYMAGIPGNGKPFPDGAKMAKIHWNTKQLETFPTATVPATQRDVDFMVMTRHPISSRPGPRRTSRRRGTTPSAGSRATRA
jgi:hypothetical protein